ncbi:hypothetical protein [Microcoleus sp. herbarium12]|uniref:hypothetical protein n=1 Tax=Microcoleus sp. herbarium12 TaxID=3055437 RepID=UPI003FA5E294
MNFEQIKYDLPFFAADLVTIPSGYLIDLDTQPLFGGDADYQAEYTRSIAQIFQVHQPYLAGSGDFPVCAAVFPSRRCCGIAPRKWKFWRLRFSQHSKTISLLM